MKSKGFTYLLLIVVAIIWYNVFFRIKDNIMGENLPVADNMAIAKMYKTQPRKEFTLKANYRDPFSSKGSSITIASTNTTPQIPVQPVFKEPKLPPPPPKVHHWPKIKYFGTVKNNSSKKALCIVNIDDMLFNLREGESVLDGIVIKKIYRDSLYIQQGKNFKMVKK
jgi:hypothetical protein